MFSGQHVAALPAWIALLCCCSYPRVVHLSFALLRNCKKTAIFTCNATFIGPLRFRGAHVERPRTGGIQRMSAFSRFNVCDKRLSKEQESGEVQGCGPHLGLLGIDRQVIGYSAKWHIVGVYLRCVSCGESQRASCGYEPFLHYRSCPHKSLEEQYPWHDLRKILSNLPEQ